jgi:hypothetical protein
MPFEVIVSIAARGRAGLKKKQTNLVFQRLGSNFRRSCLIREAYDMKIYVPVDEAVAVGRIQCSGVCSSYSIEKK